ncbi:MAG TPA: type II CAAX endopeptidase family protein, partial [Verrucomicrobiae bacterium]|nr:type II CAAX endopeptidase family protein [Verrucomicrobiae bacterium]
SRRIRSCDVRVRVNLLDKTSLIVPLVIWAIATAVYGVALFAVGNYDVISFIYHVFLLALAIFCAVPHLLKIKPSVLSVSLKNELGLRIGNWRRGVLLVLAFLGYLLVASFIEGFSQFTSTVSFASFSAVIFAPITEEIFWRGLIQQRMLKLKKLEPLYVVALNAVLFGAMHIPKLLYFHTLQDFVPIVALGIIFSGTCYLTKNSVYYSTAMHMLDNLFAS